MRTPTRPLQFRSSDKEAAAGRPRRRSVVREWRETLGQYIGDLRNERGMTGQDLADGVGLNNRQVISAIETGQTSVLPERVAAFADALKVPRAEFARTVLRYQNPWLYADIVGLDADLAAELEDVAERINIQARGPRRPA